jgi:DNA-binding CsgD family transcriptional regulator
MATRGQIKSVEFKQAGLAAPADVVAEASAVSASLPPLNSTVALKGAGAARLVLAASTRSAMNGGAPQRIHTPPSPVAAAAGQGAPAAPRFTAEETILLRGLASGSSSKEMAVQMRLPRESLYRLIGDLRRKTGASSDAALAVWVLRNMGSGGSERRGGGR